MTTETKATVSSVGPRLIGKTSIITGAGSGMGYAAAERFLAEGGNVVAVDLREEGLKRLEEAAGGDALVTRTLDVTDAEGVKALVDETVERFGALDTYFNNAGVPFVAHLLEDVTDEEWDLQMNVNLKAILYAARAAVPVMKKQGHGNIIITASMAGMRPRRELLPYTVSKGAAVHMAKAMAVELAPDQIRVNAVCPVATDTPMLAEFGAGDHITANATPMGRLGQPEEVGAVAPFLASDDAGFLTGLAIPVDGGRSI